MQANKIIIPITLVCGLVSIILFSYPQLTSLDFKPSMLALLNWQYLQSSAFLIGYGLLAMAFYLRNKQYKSLRLVLNDELYPVQHDMTKTQANYQRLKSNYDQLKRANQASYAELDLAKQRADNANEQKSQFLAEMSHEIRTPLNAINGFTELLLMSSSHKDEKYLKYIHQSGYYLLDLINDILDLSQLESSQASLSESYCDLSKLMADVCELLAAQNNKPAVQLLAHKNNDSDFHVWIDERRIKQVLINLLGNSLKYTQSGYVSIQARLDETEENDLLCIEICDTGDGMTEQQIAEIAKPFKRFHIDEVGTGLGMTITQRLITLMAGEIAIASKPGDGSRINLTIPLLQQSKPASNTTRQEVAEASPPDYATFIQLPSPVLVVDDQRLNTELIGQYLEKLGVDYVCCQSGVEALNYYQNDNSCLTLLDIRMPAIDGYETCRLLRQVKAHQGYIVALSANAMTADKTMAERAGFDEYLTKPLGFEQLKQLCLKLSGQLKPPTNTTTEQNKVWFDWPSLLAMTANDEHLALDMAQQLLQEVPVMIDRLEQNSLLSHSDSDLIHQWIGLFCYCGASKLGDKFQQIEVDLKQSGLPLEQEKQLELVDNLRELMVQAFVPLRFIGKNMTQQERIMNE